MSAGFLKMPGSGAPTAIAVTIPTSGWTEADGGHYVDVTVDGVLGTDCPVVDIDCSNAASVDALTAEWSKIWKIETSMGSIRCYATEVPTMTIPVRLLMVR